MDRILDVFMVYGFGVLTGVLIIYGIVLFTGNLKFLKSNKLVIWKKKLSY